MKSAHDLASRSVVLVLPQAVVDGLDAQSENLCGLMPVAATVSKGRHDEPALRFREGRAQLGHQTGPELRLLGGQQPLADDDLEGRQEKAVHPDALLGQDESAMDYVPELAHVAWPAVAT